jgi:phage shock protein A
MGIFKRMSNVFRAKVNDAIDSAENPMELLNQKIRDMDESLNTAKLSSAQILGNVHEIEKKMKNAKNESIDFDQKVKLAMSKGNEELAKMALQKKLDADKSYNSLKSSYDEAYIKGQAVKAKLKELEEEIEKTRNYRDEAAARFNNAEASEKVNEILANIDTGNNKINLDEIERKIQKKESMAEGMEDLKPDHSLEDEFKKLDDVDLNEELKKYKQN